MANNWDAQIATLAPDHYWKLDEVSGDYIDTGGTAGLDLSEFSAGFPWREAPALSIRGTPRQYGLWQNTTVETCAVRTASGIPTVGHLTGTFMAMVYNYGQAVVSYPLQQTFTNNAGLYIGFSIETDGSVEWKVQQGAGIRNRAISVVGAITTGTPHLLVGVQRADGNGMILYIDGVDATNFQDFAGGGITTDSYIAAVLSGQSASDLSLGGVPNTAPTLGGAGATNIIGPSGIWVNTALSASQILDLFNAIGGFDQTPTDWYECVEDIVAGEFRYWITGWTTPVTGGSRAIGIFNDAVVADPPPPTAAMRTPPSSVNVADSGGSGEQRVSPYVGYHNLFGTNNGVFTAPAPLRVDGASDFTGTASFLIKVSSAPVGISKTMIDVGVFANQQIEFQIVGGILGWSMKLRMEGTGADFWQGIGFINTFPDTDVHMLTYVQDGTGVEFYLDGNSVIVVPTSSGVSVDDTSWFSTIITLNAASILFMGSLVGSSSLENFQPNELHDVLVTRKVMSAAEVAKLWNAVSANFAPSEPFGAWASLLDMTGNSGAGPDWWWRMNVPGGVILDVGSAQDRPGPTPPPINADAIVAGGDPTYQVAGPLPADAGNFAIYFDGVGDFFEIGVNGVAGELVDSSTGSIGFFFSRASLDDENIVYSQGNDAYTAFFQFGMNGQRLELIVQTSAGNRVTLTGSIDHSGDYVEAVLTCDGTNYRLYDAGVEDTLATIVELGTGAEGDWFDAFTADQSAVGARADNTFTTETTGRPSEIFIYDGEVLSAGEAAALAAASVVDGITGTPNTVGLVSFENVTFRGGAFADIRAEESTGLFKQVVKVNRCRFLGGAEGTATYEPQVAIFKGPAQVVFRGCEFDLEAVPTFGRGGIIGTAIDTSLSATADGSLIVSDCDFSRMGYLDGSTFLAPVMCQAAFGMTVEGNRFRNSVGTAVGWNADAQRVSVLNNQIQGTSSALGAIYAARALNARVGSGWTVRGNKMLDISGDAIDITGGTSGGVAFARNIAILANETNAISGVAIRVDEVADAVIEDNVGSGSTDGVRLFAISDSIVVRHNEMKGCSLTAFIADEATLQLADVVFDGNICDALDSGGDGLLVTQVQRATVINNKLGGAPLNNGVGIGEITIEAIFDGNQVEATLPFQILPATTQVGFSVGTNTLESLGNANEITVSSAAITVIAHYHTIDAAAPINLDTINGPSIDGYLLVLRRGLFSSNITLRDGIDNLQLGSDFLMDVDNDQIWLVRDGTDWHQASRVQAL